MRPRLIVFESSPDEGQGLARDMRVRWAFEEVDQPYDVRTVSFAEMKQPAHLALHAFGQIPTCQFDDLVLFESGAIVLHIAEHHDGLLPADADARARATAWMFAALNTIEPSIVEREQTDLIERDKPCYGERVQIVDARIRDRLDLLVSRLGRAEWLDGGFSLGDLMMVLVLRRLEGTGILGDYPSLVAYIARGGLRPAYRRAFEAQRRVFEKSQHGAE